ncbi:MAG: hypothetical protein ACTS8U_01740 [Arsenophonus sp. ET-DL9-MAG3]
MHQYSSITKRIQAYPIVGALTIKFLIISLMYVMEKNDGMVS